MNNIPEHKKAMVPQQQITASLELFEAGSLYILLFRHPNPAIKYHWALYHHATPTTGGWKFDIIRADGQWITSVSYDDGSPRTDVVPVTGDEPLACAVRLGIVGMEAHEPIMAEDGRLNETNEMLNGELSCRVYVERACKRLRQGKRLVFTLWQELEDEVLATGERAGLGGKRSIVIVDSEVAKSKRFY